MKETSGAQGFLLFLADGAKKAKTEEAKKKADAAAKKAAEAYEVAKRAENTAIVARREAEEAATTGESEASNCGLSLTSSAEQPAKRSDVRGEFVKEVSDATNINVRTVERVFKCIDGMTDEKAKQDREAKATEKKAKADAAKKAKTEEAKKKADAEAKKAAEAYEASRKTESAALMDRQRAEEAANAVWPDCPQDVSSSDSSKGTAAKGEFVQEVSKATNISERTVRRVLHRIEGMTDEQAAQPSKRTSLEAKRAGSVAEAATTEGSNWPLSGSGSPDQPLKLVSLRRQNVVTA